MVKRNYRKEYDNYHSKPEQKANRASRGRARYAKAKKLGVKPTSIKGDVAHKNGNPKDNRTANLKVESKSKNRSFARTKTARKKNKSS